MPTPLWTKQTEMTVLPSADGWTYIGTAPEATYCSVAGGILTTQSTGANQGNYRIAATLSNVNGWTHEFFIKPLSHTSATNNNRVSILDGIKNISFHFKTDGIYIEHLAETIAIDLSSNFNKIRIIGKGSDFFLYINDGLLYDGKGKLTDTSGVPFNQINIGSFAVSSCQWDYYYYNNTGAFPPAIARKGKNPQYKILFYDNNGIKTGELTNETAQRVINKFDFELNETGCGAFNISMVKLPEFDIFRNDIIKIYLMDTASAWYSGYIQKIPEAGRTENIYIYSGYGFVAELDTIVANKSYISQELSVIATDLLDVYIVPKTRVLKNVAKIQATTYTAGEMNFEYTKVKKSIYDIVSAGQDWVAGVDETNEFFFLQRSTAIQVSAVKAIEKHIDVFLPKEDVSGIVNRYYVKGGAISGASNFMTIVEDIPSQALYGLREEVITIPTTNNIADAAQWAEGILNLKKDPVITATVSNIDITFLGEKIEAKGKARILLKAV